MQTNAPIVWVAISLLWMMLAPTVVAVTGLSRSDMIDIANSGVFEMIPANMEKFDWSTRYKDWETIALESDSQKSITARYGEEMIGMPHWFCDIDNGCSSLPTPLAVFEFVNATELEMSSEEIIKEAQARYWAAMNMWAAYRTGQHQVNSLTRALNYVLPRIQSIIYAFTKQDDQTVMLHCTLKRFFIEQAYKYVIRSLTAGLDALAKLAGTAGTPLPDPAELDPLIEALSSGDENIIITKLREAPKLRKEILKLHDADPWKYVGKAKEILDFTLPFEHEVAWGKNHPAGNETAENNWLRLGSMGYTSDLFCGTMDGIAGTGGDNMYRIADAEFHLSEIMNEYIENISSYYRELNGLTTSKRFGRKLSDWMINGNFDSLITRLDRIDVAKEARQWSKNLEGYFISAAWASNKCYMKCQSGMNPLEVTRRCHDTQFADARYCPADSPDTLCQVNCYTMMSKGNHEKYLFGNQSLAKFGFTLDEAKKNSWDHYKNSAASLEKPTVEFEDGVGNFNTMGSYSPLTLTVALSNHHMISDDPLKSKNFPCFSGQDWRGLDTQAHLTNMGMGIGSTDWGEEKKANPRAWEMFQHHCPEQTRGMPPLTRYMNMVCGQSLVWPEKNAENILLGNKIMKPDVAGKNREICHGLRKKTENIDEQSANYLFCSGSWPESALIFDYEISWVYTDWNIYWHRGSGNWKIFNHKTECTRFMKYNKNFVLSPTLADEDWGANKSRIVGTDGLFSGTVLALDGSEPEELRQLEEDAKEHPDMDGGILDPDAKDELELQIKIQLKKSSESQ